ncbi:MULTISPECIES: hypothetical protein [Streptomyces]|uniref:Tetratricopeptide repeat protein n=1 Tax=Streptomyces solicathayae TaxID=3081768 RepID=A0ABZ0LRB1_9ACTN|nr:hypothetical protein [Streptomyces sp. HUAS YS2]WOX21344.1 hypothetical protein R2D22_08070 [Streptomyces sp. HUAS YS2]
MSAWLRRSSRKLVYDPAHGDRALADGCQDMLMGRWEGARELLAEQPYDDWDRRAHRVRLLADAAAGLRTVDVWHAAEPGSPDAAVLRAETEVMRMFAAARSGTSPAADVLDGAARLCLRASELAPADPQPWGSLIALGRLYPAGHNDMGRWWQELRTRDPYHREGHHQALRYLSARWHGSHGEAQNFAWDTVDYAPPGSPLTVLPLVARAEHYRYRLEHEGRTAIGLTYHWNGERAQWDLRVTLEKWIGARTTEYAQDVPDLNHLAHALVNAGRKEEAGDVFRLLANRATKVPWSYTGDPEQLFTFWRDEALAV